MVRDNIILGEVYQVPDSKLYVMPIGFAGEEDGETYISVFYVDPESFETVKGGELSVTADQSKEWKVVKI